MRCGVDIGVDAQRNARLQAHTARPAPSRSASSPSDSQLKPWIRRSSAYSISADVFPTPEKTTVARVAAGFEHAEQLAGGNDIEAGAGFGYEPQNR